MIEDKQRFIGNGYLVIPEAGLDLVFKIAMTIKTLGANGVPIEWYTLRELASSKSSSFAPIPLANGYLMCPLELSDRKGSELNSVIKPTVRTICEDDPKLDGTATGLNHWRWNTNREMRDDMANDPLLKLVSEEV